MAFWSSRRSPALTKFATTRTIVRLASCGCSSPRQQLGCKHLAKSERTAALPKISGVTYLEALLRLEEFPRGQGALWIVSSEPARLAASQYLAKEGLDVGPQRFYVAANKRAEDHALLLKLEEQRPEHIVIATEGQQEAWAYTYATICYTSLVFIASEARSLFCPVRSVQFRPGLSGLEWVGYADCGRNHTCYYLAQV